MKDGEIGTIMICARCNRARFRRCTGKGEADGGYTRWNEFEKAPGWEHVKANPGVDWTNTVALCPDCLKEYQDLTEAFLKGNMYTLSSKRKETRIILETTEEMEETKE